MVDRLPQKIEKGRGAVSNPVGRFEHEERFPVGDGWLELEDNFTGKLKTEIMPDSSKSVISRNSSPDIPFDRSVNPYKGCEHGCIYCFARPTHSYLSLSPGLDFETKIFF